MEEKENHTGRSRKITTE